jgi:hypothetical protein
MSQRVPIHETALPALIAAAGERAGMRFLEFFVANIRNPHTRRAYARAAEEFLALVARPPARRRSPLSSRVHVATWIEAGTRELAVPSVKQRLPRGLTRNRPFVEVGSGSLRAEGYRRRANRTNGDARLTRCA